MTCARGDRMQGLGLVRETGGLRACQRAAAVAKHGRCIYLGLAAGQIAALVHVMLADAVEDALHLGHLGHLRPTLPLRHVAARN